jgi:uncharacterized repeat protein (TIGR01451 family)
MASPRLYRHTLVTFVLLILGMVGTTHERGVRAATNTVTFTVTRIKELVCGEGAGEACPNDYYAKVDIDNQGFDRRDWCHNSCSDDFQPNWVFSRPVDSSHNPVSIHVEVWDQDDLSADDPIDIANGGNDFDITVDLNNCTWQGGGLKGFVNTSASTQGTGEDSAQVYFTVSTTAPGCADSDGDGLLDAWETNGFDADGDGIIDVDLPAMGANPQRKDLFLQIDYLSAATHSHAPIQAAIQQVVQAFANAPLGNPDGTTGIQLHVDVGPLYGANVVTKIRGTGGVTGTFGDHGGGGNAITESGNTIVDYTGAAGTSATNFFTLKALNPNRDNIFRYALFVHQTNARRAANDCTSGLAKGIPGVNFLISLGGVGTTGNPCWGTDAGGNSVGSQATQAGTLMHEFGHTLGLQHGGGDGLNNKPNYFSVMNYSWQTCAVPAQATAGLPGGCDFSRLLIPAGGLNENSLDECQGLDNLALGFGPVDFNGDGRLAGVTNCRPPNNANIIANINSDTSADANANGVQDGAEPPLLSTLNGFQDWNAIVYSFRTQFDFTTAGQPTEQEADPTVLANARRRMADLLHPALSLDKTGPPNARPGDTLSYNLAVGNLLENGGRGPAAGVVVTDTRPDQTNVTLTIGTLVLTTSVNRPVSYLVPCSTADGALLTNTARADGLDLVGNAVTSSDSVQTSVHAPVLTLSASATSSVNAGEAVTYTIVYANTGSGDAASVVITDTLPAGIYYSTALDQGTGPKPSSVTLNANGSRTLTWNVGAVAGASGPQSIVFTARPTLLALSGTTYDNAVTLGFKNGNGCSYDTVSASASTTITVVPATMDPLSQGFWNNHPELETAELLARIQATDQRFDAAAADGRLSTAEVQAVFGAAGSSPTSLLQQLLATYFNLATRRINAGTPIASKTDTALGLTTVHGAALLAASTLALPPAPNSARYGSATTALEEINTAKSIR